MGHFEMLRSRSILRSSSGSVVLIAVVTMTAAVWAIGLFSIIAQSQARKQILQNFSRQSLSDTIGVTILNQTIANLGAEVRDPSTGGAPTGDLEHLFPGPATKYVMPQRGKGDFILPFVAGIGIQKKWPSNAALATLPPIIGPEEDPVVEVQKNGVNCKYKITVNYKYCLSLMLGRQPFTPRSGIGQPWDLPCPADDIRGVSKVAILNLASNGFKLSQTVYCP